LLPTLGFACGEFKIGLAAALRLSTVDFLPAAALEAPPAGDHAAGDPGPATLSAQAWPG
jgi:hypothetical protein